MLRLMNMRLALLCLMTTVSVAACSGNGGRESASDAPVVAEAVEQESFTSGWRGPDGAPAARGEGADRTFEVQAHPGPDHCGWDEATFLSVGWPLGTSPRTSDEMRQYIRDERRAVGGARFLGDFDADTKLPEDAKFTGYETDSAELWFGPDEGDEVVYLRLDDRVEQWPRTAEVVACA